MSVPLIDCEDLEETRDYLFQQFQSCNKLEAEDLQLLTQLAFSATGCVSFAQNNLFTEIDLGTILSSQTVSELINALPDFTISDTELVIFKVLDEEGVEFKFVSNLGKGDFGISNPVYTDANLILINRDNILSTIGDTTTDFCQIFNDNIQALEAPVGVGTDIVGSTTIPN